MHEKTNQLRTGTHEKRPNSISSLFCPKNDLLLQAIRHLSQPLAHSNALSAFATWPSESPLVLSRALGALCNAQIIEYQRVSKEHK